jgi:hypothetical protein
MGRAARPEEDSMALTLASPLPKGAEYCAEAAEAAAAAEGVSPYLLLGICYAESNFGQALKPKGPAGSGDFIARPTSPDRDKRMAAFPLPGVVKKMLEDGIPQRKLAGPITAWVPTHTGWGCGLMQFDYEAHFEFCKSGDWKEPEAIMRQAAKLLKHNVASLKKLSPDLKGADLGMAAIAAYNAGPGRVAKFLKEGKGLDAATFHPGYHTKIMKKADELAGASGAWMPGLV